jgi:protein polybromo-1
MKTIAKRVRQGTYKTLKQMEADFILMTDNAKRYNAPKSVIYKDACKLKVLAKETAKALSKQPPPPLNTDTIRIKIVNELVDLTQNEFNKKLLEAEAEAASVINQTKNAVKQGKKAAKEKEVKEEDDDDEDEEEEEEDDDDEDEDESNEKTTAHSSSTTPSTNFLSGKRNHPLMIAMWSLFDYMRDYTNEAGVSIVEPFVKLPSKRIYPDYFEEIKHPISLNQIKSKLHKRIYTSLQDLSKDFALLFANAMQYNLEDSIIYGHAKELKRVYEEKSEQVAAAFEANGGMSEFKSEAIISLTPAKQHHHHGKKLQQQQHQQANNEMGLSGSASSGYIKKFNYDVSVYFK